MDDVELANLVANISRGPVEVGLLERKLADSIGAGKNGMVLLSEYTYDKERFTHPDILFSDFPLLSLTMRKGYAVKNPERPRHLMMGYIAEEREGRPFKLVLKATKDDSGIHVETFHRTNFSEFRRLLRQASKRNSIIRNPYPEIIKRQTE
ncbi:MAG: hypothetical protein O3A85_02180 [Proteobacteria bacterium]|nr:hypothetical protein [Pseudomonadota bacterium]